MDGKIKNIVLLFVGLVIILSGFIFLALITGLDTFFTSNTNSILALAQIATLIAIIVYVIKTWEMASATRKYAEISENTLQEMKEARDQEIAPYIVAYFDMPYGENLITLVLKNIGKSIAENVKIEINPRLVNSHGIDFNSLPLIKNGVTSILQVMK